jgi:hypothetical protein
MTGIILTFSLGVIFLNEIIQCIDCFYREHQFIKELSFLITLFFIPIVYFVGHFFGGISYFSLKLYNFTERKFKGINKNEQIKLSRNKKIILDMLELFIYKLKIGYAINQFCEEENGVKMFLDNNQFWVSCAKLQVKKNYEPAQYWEVITGFYDILYFCFLFSCFISVTTSHYIFGFAYLILAIFSFYRAKQHAKNFVKTVNRLLVADSEIQIR